MIRNTAESWSRWPLLTSVKADERGEDSEKHDAEHEPMGVKAAPRGSQRSVRPCPAVPLSNRDVRLW